MGFCTFNLELSATLAALSVAPLSVLPSLNIHCSVVAVAQYTFSVFHRQVKGQLVNYTYAYKADLYSGHSSPRAVAVVKRGNAGGW